MDPQLAEDGPPEPPVEHCRYCDKSVLVGTTCPRSLECPRCGAAAGSPCIRPSGHRAMIQHSARIYQAELADFTAGVGPHPDDIRV